MNYFSSLPFREQVQQLGTCRFMDSGEFHGTEALKGSKIVILGCGAQGLNQGLNLRDSGLDVGYALRPEAIAEKRQSYQNATEYGFQAGTFEEMIPDADMVMNLTPDKQHSPVVGKVLPLLKKGATLAYSHGFNIVEEGMQIRDDITVVMIAPKSPGSEVREEYKRGFGVPTLIAVHPANDPQGKGWEIAKSYAVGLGSDRAGVLASSFVAEVKSDLMGEQTILCGMLQTGSLLCYDKMTSEGVDERKAASLVQFGWEGITEALKHGGITHMMDRLSNPAKVRANELAERLKTIMKDLYYKHMDDILSAKFSETMMTDWKAGDRELLTWREETGATAFEKTANADRLPSQTYFDEGVVMVAMVKAGVELAFEAMVDSGIKEESAYYESLHELPLIANLISRKKLYEMNRVISDTAEYGNYLFSNVCVPLLKDFMGGLNEGDIGRPYPADEAVDDVELINVNESIRTHAIEKVGKTLRAQMKGMKALAL
ncbi:MAG: ketol-acid reductoisomerase [Spirochaetaceae bacterium]|nr:ketol-acid reductoisomerase [Spirochaetaceae bacterium]MDT8297509.1 ketol-acid reductoisomerase [Spirochaetaceae bacterium]